MGLLKKIEVRNFKCFRSKTAINLGQSTYLIGPNNSGKTAVLSALHCFFDTGAFSAEFLNKTEFAAKKVGFNRSDISVTFDITKVGFKAKKRRLSEKYGESITVTKRFTWRETTKSLYVDYVIGSTTCDIDGLDEDIRTLLAAVSISYMHPQEGKELLLKAQEKFKRRLFHNWGRHASVAGKVKNLQDTWQELRSTANSYLSTTLSERLQNIWPGAEIKIDLPARIQDIVAVSDIAFRSSPTLPQVTLTSHGTGAQSTVLYQTHYLLDSDRTLHTGMYFPVWLVEEPESFLHANMTVQLARLLNSSEWLANIQMVISTHSPIILAGSRTNADITRWAICENHAINREKSTSEVTSQDIVEVGRMMGDVNFGVYFDASTKSPRVFLEDTRQLTSAKFKETGLPITKGLNGITEVKRYIDVLVGLGSTLYGETYFIIDSDAGRKELEGRLTTANLRDIRSGWTKYEIAANVYVLALPEGKAVEDLFLEWETVVDGVLNDIFCKGSLKLRKSTPASLSKTVTEIRNRRPATIGEARALVKRQYETKERFWKGATAWSIEAIHVDAIKLLMRWDERVTAD